MIQLKPFSHLLPSFFCLFLLQTYLLVLPAQVSAGIKDVVVKIYTVYNKHNYHEPWQMHGQESRQGSGVIISGNRILTNAHVVSDKTFIQVRKSGKVKRYTATVDKVYHKSDLAILKVKDDSFFLNVSPIPYGSLPDIKDDVFVYGFPVGGDKLSITRGVISRVEHKQYNHSSAYLLACQIDASVNQGSSGGPVVQNDKIVGIALQTAVGNQIENIGYIVPVPVIEHFLEDISDENLDGIPALGLSLQRLENPDMRRKYMMKETQTGVLVVNVYPGSPVAGKIQTGDVIVRLEEKNIDNDGTIEFRKGERTYLEYLVQKKQINETSEITVFRNGNLLKVKFSLSKPLHSFELVPHEQYDVPPEYYIIGGLVFMPLTLNYLMEYGSEENFFYHAPTELLNYYYNGEQGINRREILILSKVLAHDVNIGYHDFVNGVINKVNGIKLKKMEDLVEAFETDVDDRYHEIEDIRGFTIVLDKNNVVKAQKKILKNYKIASDRSEHFLRE